MASVPELIEWLESRLDDFPGGDPRQVLDERVLAVADELRARRITDIELAGSACTAIATLHMYRASKLEENESLAEMTRSAGLWATIAQIRPDLVPPDIRRFIELESDPQAPAESRVRDLRDYAIDSRDAAALSLAAALFRGLVTHPNGARLEDLASMAEILWARVELVRDIEDLDEAVAIGRVWLDNTPELHVERAFRLWRLGLAEFVGSLMLGDPGRLDEAIACHRAAVATASGDDPQRQSYFSDLALALNQRATITNRIEHVDAAVNGWMTALENAPSGHSDCGPYQYNLGTMLWRRFEAAGEPTDLDAALASWSAALDHFPVGHRSHGTVASLLAVTLRVRADRNGTVGDADEAIRILRTLIDGGGSGEDPAKLLSSLGNAQSTRYDLAGDENDLEQAVAAGRSAVDQTPPDSPFLCHRTSNLSASLRTKYRRTSRLRDIAEAADLARISVRSMPADMQAPGPILSNAGNALRELAERAGDPADLETATALLRKAVDSFHPTDYQRAAALFNLTITLEYRAERTGDLEILDEAVAIGRQAVRETHDGGPYLAGHFANLASAFRRRYQLTGDASDLDEAVDAADEALNRTPVTHRARATRAHTLSSVLVTRYQRFGERDALDEAILLGCEAIDLTHAGHVGYSVIHTNLASAYLERYLSVGDAERDLADLEAAVSLAHEAVSATPEDDPLRAVPLMNLGVMIYQRFTTLSDEDDLERATALAREALDSAPEDGPERANIFLLLGKVLGDRFYSNGDEASGSEAAASFAAAAAIPTGPVALRVSAAFVAATLLMLQDRSRSAQALPLLREAVELLPRMARHSLDRGDRRHLLENDAATVAVDAAACALNAGDPAEAVRLLEQGRGIVWGQLLDLRSDRDLLLTAHPKLAAELERCLAVLDPAGADAPLSPIPESLGRFHIDQSEAVRRLDDLVARVRALPPTERFPDPEEFMGPPRLAHLMPPQDAGPVVILNASRWRCDALVVSPSGIAVVPMPFNQPELAEETNRYLNALRRNTGPVRDPELETEANRVLEWLWDHVAEPVLDHLGFVPKRSDLPRIWWCPTGPLTLLPVHAAGYHDRDDGSTVLDRAVSSYTPTLRALAHARSITVPDRIPTPLLVSIADTPGPFAKLPGVAKEQRMFTEHFGSEAVTSLSESEATRDAIIAGLGAHSMVHIASHGIQDLSRPADGGLVPFDWETAGLVRVDDLAQITPGPRSLAFLSACQTATGGAVNLDEAMNIAAAMQYVGWPHVVGTLWTIFDGAASLVAGRFYGQVIRDGQVDLSASAFALHEAVRALRAEAPRDAAYWARFVHLGP
ncbi:CHAT domain-containing protein [Glycomyces buryatensis]|uniref:CHAT domain-containing protein n=1 Tax=Glycomyces buryatensis TaxID=2570927 RepID=A0A4S8Q202_9ACTN|nr:CHAT domain-containing protein [Glycomyces buryatensis]THV36472.1 CHAT domain-containing protein [Glycomyces buryatensis]